MKVIAALLDPASIKKLLDALGLPSKAPPIAPPRYEQLELDDACRRHRDDECLAPSRHTQRPEIALPPSTRRPQTTDKAAYPGDPYQAFVQQLEREGFRVLSRAALRPDVVS